jgi:hypothetical protein
MQCRKGIFKAMDLLLVVSNSNNMLIDLRLEHIMHTSETEMLQVRAEEASADE